MGRITGFRIGLLVLPLLVAACSGGEQERPLPRILEVTAERDVVNGEALPSSQLEVRLDRDFELVEGRTPLASHFELWIPDVSDGIEGPVFVRSAERNPDNPRTFTLGVDRLLPEGTVLRIAKKAFRAGEEGTIEGRVSTDLSASQVFFATTLFQFGDPALTDDQPGAPALDPDEQDVGAQRALLTAHLEARAALPETVSVAIARFDAMAPAIVPSPKLRAAIAALTGTFAEPALDYLLGDLNCTGRPAALIAFQPPPDQPDLLARSSRTEDGALVISINPRLAGERIEHLMPILVHEATHCDEADGRFEEIAATAFDTLFYIQLLVSFPDLPRAGTTLSRELNVDALAMLNSGRAVPESGGVLATAGAGAVLPGSSSSPISFADLVAEAYPGVRVNSSPTEDLALVYADILARQAGMEAGDPFNLLYLDELIARSFSADMIIALLETLDLVPA
ncbi:MAG: hypothetical protein ACE5EF_05365 [Dehalococcoidia bacterium]